MRIPKKTTRLFGEGRRSEEERLARNEALLGSITIELDEEERASLIVVMERIGPALMKSELRLLRKLKNKKNGQINLEGWERSQIREICTGKKKLPKSKVRASITAKLPIN